MSNIELLKGYEQRLDELVDSLNLVTKDYYVSRLNFAKANHQINLRLAKLMLSEKWENIKNYGFEKLLIVLIKEALLAKDTKFIKLVEHWEVDRGLYKSLDRAISTKDTSIKAIQSTMKNLRDGELSYHDK